MVKLIDMTERDKSFLKNLDGQLRVLDLFYDPSAKMEPKGFYNEEFLERGITDGELKKVLSITRKNNVVFYPSTTQFGFATAFGMTQVDVIAPGVEPVTELLLRFRESQLPEGYNFERLSEYFMEEMNLRTAKAMGVEIQNNRAHYDY